MSQELRSSSSCKAAVFTGAGQPLQLQEFSLSEPLADGAALCRVRLCTICGSDLHTVEGRRQEPTPAILGHEIVGELVALGPGLSHDSRGAELHVGDRITWSIVVACGDCFYCDRNLPQKCLSLRKYGHMSCDEWPHLTGGYAEMVYLLPNTAIYKVPDELPDSVVAPANCAMATAFSALEMAELQPGETVLVQGAGMLGLNLAAIAREADAGRIIVTDVNRERLALARRFGAHDTINLSEVNDEEAAKLIRAAGDGHGVDVAFEVCGVESALALGIQSLRIGGRYVLAGTVVPGIDLPLTTNQVIRRCLTVRGIHNYRPVHLAQALDFLVQHGDRYPYRELVGETFTLSEINDAMQAAATGRHIRVAVRP